MPKDSANQHIQLPGENFTYARGGYTIRMVLATAAVKDSKLRHIDVEEAFLQANVDDEKIYIELPEEYQEFRERSGG